MRLQCSLFSFTERHQSIAELNKKCSSSYLSLIWIPKVLNYFRSVTKLIGGLHMTMTDLICVIVCGQANVRSCTIKGPVTLLLNMPVRSLQGFHNLHKSFLLLLQLKQLTLPHLSDRHSKVCMIQLFHFPKPCWFHTCVQQVWNGSARSKGRFRCSPLIALRKQPGTLEMLWSVNF